MIVASTGAYLAAAYLVVFVVVLAWVLIIATKLARLEREVGDLSERARLKQRPEPEELPPGEPAANRG
jgi:CcmD family protein